MSNMRFMELAEVAISYLYDNDLLDDFCEDRGVELSDEEKKYFEIEESEEG